MIEKTCKECGKIFLANSDRQQYCTDIHYRACPVCGKMVEAKYLSDPARVCSKECKAKLRSKDIKAAKLDFSLSNPVNEDVERFEGSTTKSFVGVPAYGFIKGHDYEINIAKDDRNILYIVRAIKDITDNKSVDFMMPLSSYNSVKRNFQ